MLPNILDGISMWRALGLNTLVKKVKNKKNALENKVTGIIPDKNSLTTLWKF